jgi:hypothetical protein
MSEAHTDACNNLTAKVAIEQFVFDFCHPKACQSCDGLGWIDSPDPDVGLFFNPEPCQNCEDRSAEAGGPVCALCGQSGDFSDRSMTLDPGRTDPDRRPCGCPIDVSRPQQDMCGCWLDDDFDLFAAPARETPSTREQFAPATPEPYDFAADDFAYDAAREQYTSRLIGRD